MQLVYSDVESRRFGLRVFRCTAEALDVAVLQDSIHHNRVDLAICRVPAIFLSRMSELDQLHMPYVVADILVHYAVDLETRGPATLRNTDLDIVEGSVMDAGQLGSIVRQTFSDYTNHYSSNPLLAKPLILEGQVEWATSYLGGSDRTAWLIRRDGKLVGFFTHLYEPHETKLVFGGVLPSERGGGIYRDFVRYSMNVAKERGCIRMHCSTQVHNIAVQGVWVAEGLAMKEPQLTFHVNALLGRRSQV